MTKRVALYARESFDGNSIVDQIVELTGVVTSRNWSVVKTYVDQTIAYDKNPQSGADFFSLCEGASQRIFDIVMVWSTDRIGRSLQEFVTFLLNLEKQGIDFYAHQQKVDTTLPADKALFRFCSLFSKFEHDITRERVYAGHQRARQQGKKIGRPRKNPNIDQEIRTYRNQGMGIKTIAKTLRVGVSVVQRVVHAPED